VIRYKIELGNSTLEKYIMFRYCSVLNIAVISFFPFLVDFLNTFIRISDYLDIIIIWLCGYCSTRLEYTLIVFRIVNTTKSSNSILLGFSRDKHHLYFVNLELLRKSTKPCGPCQSS